LVREGHGFQPCRNHQREFRLQPLRDLLSLKETLQAQVVFGF
jgi:hypothetical protein